MRNEVIMRPKIGSFASRIALRLSAVGLLALSVGACSSDTMRFTEAPFSSPFKTAQNSGSQNFGSQNSNSMRDPATTGSIGSGAGATTYSAPSYSTPTPAVASVRAQPLPPPQSSVALRSPAPAATSGSAAGWSAQGGTPIIVAQGETLDVLSSRYGVPKAALISANGLSGSTVEPGSRITIPVYSASGSSAAPARQTAQSAPVQSEPAARPLAAPPQTLAPPRAAAPVAAPRVQAMAPAVDRASAAKSAAEAKAQTAAQAKAQAAADAKAKAAADAQAMRDSRAKFAAEAKAKAEAKKTATLQPAAVPVAKPVIAEAKKLQPAPEKAKPVVVASAPATEKPEPAEPKTTASLPKQTAAPASAPVEESVADKADFRWPARGRVISGFSGKGGNEGINIAVPEGTPVKAAEGGTVAYAGNELKGYGNLVLIRHPNGYVSAYAHNGALNVKRGDSIKRGQVVATAGQTGNVSSPQLHFELRKGSTPVDPTPYLNN